MSADHLADSRLPPLHPSITHWKVPDWLITKSPLRADAGASVYSLYQDSSSPIGLYAQVNLNRGIRGQPAYKPDRSSLSIMRAKAVDNARMLTLLVHTEL
jgi:hypothetical protein